MENNKVQVPINMWNPMVVPLTEKKDKEKPYEDIPQRFWNKWIVSMPTERIELLKKLSLKQTVILSQEQEYAFYSLLNSYFEDFFITMMRNKSQQKKKEVKI